MTGGPTRAWLDRVRFLTNVSSGELAYELCRALCRRGFDVALVAGPTSQPFEKLPLARFRPVETADEMHAAVMSLCRTFRPDAAVFTAAVLDFAPARRESGKVTSKGDWVVRLKPTKKIIDDVGKRYPKIRRVGFKLEWKRASQSAARAFARETIRRKNLDALVLNFLSEIKGGAHPACLYLADGSERPARTKRAIASGIARFLSG